jgi:hypothetical protein
MALSTEIQNQRTVCSKRACLKNSVKLLGKAFHENAEDL